MPPTRDWELSYHRSRKVRSILSFISAESWSQPRGITLRWKRRPWPSNGQSWSCATTSLAGSSPWSPTTHPFSGWLEPRTPMPGWPDGSSRSRTSTLLCVIGLEPRTPTPTVSHGSGQLSQVCQGSLPTHPLIFPYCLIVPTGPGRRLGGGSVTSGPKLISVALETGEEHLPDLITGWSVTPAARHGMAT